MLASKFPAPQVQRRPRIFFQTIHDWTCWGSGGFCTIPLVRAVGGGGDVVVAAHEGQAKPTCDVVTTLLAIRMSLLEVCPIGSKRVWLNLLTSTSMGRHTAMRWKVPYRNYP